MTIGQTTDADNGAPIPWQSKLSDPVPEPACPHCGSTSGTWFSRSLPMGYICNACGNDVDRSATAERGEQ